MRTKIVTGIVIVNIFFAIAAPALDVTLPPTRIGGVFIPLHTIIDGRCFDEWLEVEERESGDGKEEEEEEGEEVGKTKKVGSVEDNDFEEGTGLQALPFVFYA